MSKNRDTDRINDFLQKQLRQRGLMDVRAVHAARWLDDAGLLRDSASRRGLPLRNLLRDGEIAGSDQRPDGPYGRWFVTRAK